MEFLTENIWVIIGIILGSGIIGGGAWGVISKYAGKGAIIFKELGEAFMASSKILEKLDKDIKNDGTLDANEIKDLLSDGKSVIKEYKDVIITIKPKKVGN